MVELYEKGYGKDAAGIAMEAIRVAKDSEIDVVLVDTAGRMQDNEPLMRALAKLIKVNEPDLVLFVGEALVGNEAVDQLVKFNQALADHSQSNNPHIIDGIVLTKFDTIDDKVRRLTKRYSLLSVTSRFCNSLTFIGRYFVTGWRGDFYDVHYRTTNRFRWHRTNVHGPEIIERESCSTRLDEIIVDSINKILNLIILRD